MKRSMFFYLMGAVLAFSAFAQDAPAQSYTPPATTFLPMVTFLGVYQPNNAIIDADIPYVMPMAQARFSHRFTEWGKKPELSFNADAQLAPVWLNANADFSFKPLSILTLKAGGSFGSSWGMDLGFLSFDLIGKYNASKEKYEAFTPFTHWVYALWAEAGFSYDIGSLVSRGRQSLTFSAKYRASYTGMTGVEKGELWLYQGASGNVNGAKYDATAALSYKLPVKYAATIGGSASFSGYYSDSFFADRYKGFDGDFTKITISANAGFSPTHKDIFMLMLPFSGSRAFDSDDKDKQPLLEAKSGRNWSWNGVVLTYTHIF